jgi:hypothetical protein
MSCCLHCFCHLFFSLTVSKPVPRCGWRHSSFYMSE